MAMIPITEQPLGTIQFHYYAPYKDFLSCLVLQSLSYFQFPHAVIVSYHPHQHPVDNYIELPFMLVNNKQVVCGERMLKMLLSFIVQGEHQRNMEGVSSGNWMLDLMPVFRLCQELSGVAQVFSDIDLNHYYTFISPIRKYKRYRDLRARKRDFQTFIMPNQQLDKQKFLLKLDQLNALIKHYDSNPLNPIIHQWINIHLEVLLANLQILHKTLYQTVSASDVFAGELMNRKKEERNRVKELMKERVPAELIISNVHLNKLQNEKIQKDKEERQKKQDNREAQQGLSKSLSIMFVVNTVFWGVYFMISS